MNPRSKFLGVIAVLVSLPLVYRVAPGPAILVGIGLLAAAYFVVHADRRR